MQPILRVGLLLLGTSLLPAQAGSPAPGDPLSAARTRLTAALQKSAALSDTAFEATWGPDRKPQGAKQQVFLNNGSPGKVAGSWHPDLAHYAFEADPKDELLVAGQRMIAKDQNLGWRLRGARFADGNPVAFLPDVALLLQQLASWDLAVVHSEVGSLDDRPVEILSVSLSPEQVGEAVWAGLVPESLQNSEFAFVRIMMAGAGGGRTAMPLPSATIDLAISIDPAASLVQKLQFRSWSKQDANGVRNVLILRAGVATQAGTDDNEEAEPQEAKAGAPVPYENGLPVRPRQKMSVMDYTVRLSEPGTHQAPALTAEQKRLLGREP